MMQSENRFAFKEWSVVCAALAAGRQTVILRKGGIHEGRDGFRVQHGEFWLFPTGFHQQPDEVIPEVQPWFEDQPPPREPPGISIELYAVVQDVHYVQDRSALARLSGRHIWSESTVEQRFQYHTPGLYVLVVRMFRRPAPLIIDVAPHFSGCKSWVDLPTALATSGLQPILDHQTFEQQRDEIRRLLLS